MSVEAYDSFEEMQKAIKSRIAIAMEHVEPWQEKISFGDHFLVWEGSAKLWVFCSVQTPEELWGDYRGSQEELAFEKELHEKAWQKGFRACKNYSAWCVEGEYGDCHVLKAFCLISREQFEFAQKNLWDMEKIMTLPNSNGIREVIAQKAREQNKQKDTLNDLFF